MAVIKWSGNIGIWTFCVVVGLAPSAFAQGQGVGAIGGIVADTSGAALPGVAVTLMSSQGTIGGNQRRFRMRQALTSFPDSFRERTACARSCRASRPSRSPRSG